MKIGIAIVDYGNPDYLKECLYSLDLLENPMKDDLNVEVWDSNQQNVGFTLGNNHIISRLRCVDCYDWYWLLNNDTKVCDGTLESMRKILPTLEDEIGIVGFKILSMDNPDLIHHAGTGECYPAGQHKSGSVKLNQFNKRTYEKWVTGASMLVRREVFETIGLLDSRMFNYFSDSDLCLRARYAGFKVIYEPTFVILHKIGQSQNPSPDQSRILFQDSVVFADKWMSGKTYFDLMRESL